MEIGEEFTYKGNLFTVYEVCKPCRKIWAKDKESTYLFKLDRNGSLELVKKYEK